MTEEVLDTMGSELEKKFQEFPIDRVDAESWELEWKGFE